MIRACIFDLGGTIVDKYSLSPFISFNSSFLTKNIKLYDRLIYKDMGKDKKEHIKLILDDPVIVRNWICKYGAYHITEDINNIYDSFNYYQNKNCKNIDIIPETKNCFTFLRNNQIKIGCTTGFNQENMNHIKKLLIYNGLPLDSYVSSTCIQNKGSFFTRPDPMLIYQNLVNLNLESSKGVLKIDDTNIGIEEGKNAGCTTIAVARWSTYMKVTPDELPNLNQVTIQSKLKESRNQLSKSNPDYLINSLNELPFIIQYLNQQ